MIPFYFFEGGILMSAREVMKWIVVVILMTALFIGVSWIVWDVNNALAEEEDPATVYVTAGRLNGRSMPRKKAFIEALFDHGDKLTATGKWSRDHKWIEVEGGEGGTVWVDIRYVSEIKQPVVVMTDVTKVKIRKTPFNGRVTGYLKNGKELEIDQIVLGWGHCSKGWIDLGYCYFVEE